MKTILSINASLTVRGGADRFFTELNRLMSERGERVATYTYMPEPSSGSFTPEQGHYFISRKIRPEGVLEKISGLGRIFYSPDILDGLKRIIDREQPSVAHIHNIYHRIPYGIIDVLAGHGIRIMWWLHDYKWICPNHQLYTRGRLCKKCRNGGYFNALFRRCQQESLYKSVIVSALSYFIAAHTWRDKIDLFIAPSKSVGSLFCEFGFPEEKIRVLPHFDYCKGEDAGRSSGEQGPAYALYTGRLEKNKGLLHCVQAFGESGFNLKIIGSGNYEADLRTYCSAEGFENIEFIGNVADKDIACYYRNALFTVVPSVWYEVFGLSIIESFHYGRPVVAADIGAIPEIVEEEKTGLLYRPGDAGMLREKIRWMFENPDKAGTMGRQARESIARRFTPDAYWSELQEIHQGLGH